MRAVTLLLLILTGLTGCVENTSRADIVADRFITLVAEKRYDDALAYVFPEDREYFSKNLHRELQSFDPLPDDPEVLVETAGKDGELIVNNWDPRAKIQLINKYGRWWIKK